MPFINNYLLPLKESTESRSKYLLTLFWGDEVKAITPEDDEWTKIELFDGKVGYTNKEVLKRENRLLSVAFLDVDQGDSTFIETPEGKRILIDAGQDSFVARYLAKKFHHKNTSEANPLIINDVIITHGDADHYQGLIELINCRNNHDDAKKFYCEIENLYHNGFIKRKKERSDGGERENNEMLGDGKDNLDGKFVITDLIDDFLGNSLQNKDFSEDFEEMIDTIKNFTKNCKRVEKKADPLITEDNLKINVLWPQTEKAGNKKGLRFLKSPGETINGHSIVLKLTYGNINFLLSGDINQAGEKLFLENADSITSEVFKVPHHGSRDYNKDFIQAVNPLISIISSGDRIVIGSDHIHPRASLISALGKYSRENSLVFSTELTAFMEYKKTVLPLKKQGGEYEPDWDNKFFGYKKSSYGIIHIRTDGEKLLAITHSGSSSDKEKYLYSVSEEGEIQEKIIPSYNKK